MNTSQPSLPLAPSFGGREGPGVKPATRRHQTLARLLRLRAPIAHLFQAQPTGWIPRTASAALVVWAMLGMLATTGVAVAQDVTAPVLQSLSFTPTSIDTTTGSATVTVTVRITDDLSGVSTASVHFYNPAGTLSRGIGFSRISGDKYDGVYQGTVTFPQYIQGGIWYLDWFYLADAVGNYRQRRESDLIAQGFPTKLTITSAPDTTAPVLQSLSFTPTSIDTTAGSATVTVTARFTDDISGVSSASVNFYSPSGAQARGGGFFRISGDKYDGVYQATVTFPQYGLGGIWYLDWFYLADAVGNYRQRRESELIAQGFPTKLTVTSNPDTTVPNLHSLSFTPTSIDTTTGTRTVTVTARITDDLSGFSSASVYFYSPSGTQSRGAGFSRISGDKYDGVYQATMTFPQYGQGGIWYLDWFYTGDAVGNYRQRRESELIAQGFPTKLNVTGNDPPVLLNPGNQSVDELATLAFTLSSTDPNLSDTPTYSIASGAQPGMSLNPSSGAFSWTPTEAQGPGSYPVTLRVTDLGGMTSSQTITITVNEVNSAPTAVAASATTTEDTGINISLTGNDPDLPSNPLSYTIVGNPAHGTLSGTAPNLTYTPAANYHGPDSVTFKVNDGTVDSASATVAITVTPLNDPPMAADDAFATDEDTVLVVASPGVLGNDSDVDAGAEVRFTFTGHMMFADADFSANERFTGFYTVNPAAVPLGHPDASMTYQYLSQNASWEIVFPDRSYRFVNDAANTWVSVGNDRVDWGDRYAVNLTGGTSTGSPLPSGRIFSTFAINLHDHRTFGADLLDDDSVQTTSIRLAAAHDPVGTLAFRDGYQPGFVIDALTGPLTLTAVDGAAANVDVVRTLPSGALLRVGVNGSLRYDPNGHFDSLRPGQTATDQFTYAVRDPEGGTATATATITITGVNDAPVAVGQSLTTEEDSALTVTLAGTDVDDDGLTFTVIGGPSHGTLTGSPPDLTYTPAANYHGPDSFTFKVSDGVLESGEVVMELTVTSVNDLPVAVDDAYPLGEDMILSPITPAVGALKNDSDADGDTLTAILVSNPSHGTVTLQPDGRFTYTPPANFNGPDSFTYKVNDGQADSGIATVTITVNPANDAPVASAQSVTTAEDTVAAMTLAASDVDGDALTYTITSNPTRGTLTGTAPNLSYRPWPHYHGPDQFTFQVSDGVASASAAVTITVTPVNDVPVASSTAVTTAEDTAASARLSASDVEAGDYRVLQVFGSVTGAGRSPSGGLIQGADQMLYGTTEFGGAGDNGTIFRVNRDGSGYTVLHNFAANRSQGAWPRARLVAGPGDVLYGTTALGGNNNAGTVWKLNTDGSGFTVLLHKPGFPGSSTGLLLGSDGALYGTTVFGGASNNGTVFKLGTDGSGYAVLHNFSGLANEGGRPYAQLVEDADGVLYGTTEVGGADAVNGGTVFKLQKNGTGFAVLQAFTGGTGNVGTLRRGLLLASDGALYGVTGTGGQNAKGTVFKVQRNGTGFQLLHQFAANGSQGGSPQAALIEDADGVLYGGTLFNGALGGGTIFRLNKDGTGFGVVHHFGSGAADGNQLQGELVVAGDGRLYGTTFAGAGPGSGVLFTLARAASGLGYIVAAGPAHGTLSGTAPNLTYTPAANYNGIDSFTYTVSDGDVESSPATVSITVTPVNDRPYPKPLTIQLAEDGSVAVVLIATDMLGNPLGATDVDGDPLTFTVDAVPGHGTFSGTPPNLTYTPELNFHGTEYLSYYVSDGIVTSSRAALNLVMTPVNDAPVDRDRTLGVLEDNGGGQVQPQVDADGDAVTYFVVTPPQHGRVELQGGNLIYLPDANYNGPDSYTFKATDGTLESPLYTYTLTVLPLNDAPVAASQSVTTAEDTAAAIALDGSDVDGDTLTFAVVNGPVHGTLNGTPPNLTYTPVANYHGADSFTFTAGDGTVTSSPATVSITVTSVNDAPVAVDDNYTVTEDVSLVAPGGIGSLPHGGPGTAVGSVDRTATFDAVVFGTDLNGYTEGGLRVSVPKIAFISGALYGGYFYPNAGANAATSIRTTDGSKLYALEFATSDGWGDPHPISYLHWWMLDNNTIVADGVFETGHRTVSGFSRGAGFDELLVGAYHTPAEAAAATPTSYQALALDNLKVQLKPPGVLANDTDADEHPLSAQLVTGPQHGTVTLLADGGFTYSPELNFVGADAFTYRVNDGTADSPPATVSLTVTPVNDLPTAEVQSLTTYDNAPLAITLAGADIETAPLTYRIVSGPTVGSLSGTPPNVTFTPPFPFAGNSSFTFEVEDAAGAKAQAIVTINILASDRPPVAVAGDDQSVTAGTDCLATVTVDGSASSDADGDALGYSWQLFLNGEVVDTASGQAAVSWSLPHGTYEAVLTVSTDKNGTVVSRSDSLTITVLPSAPALATLNPTGAYANGPAFTLTLTGGCFLPGAVVQWNGSPRTTTVVSSSELTTSIPASDLQTGVDIAVASVTVLNGDGQVSNPLGFSIVAQTVGTADAAVTPPGETSTVSTAPSTAGEPGVSVTVQNNGDQPVTVLAATYDTRPVGETAFQVDNGSFVDVQVTGADENVAATVFFYYPSSTTGGMENRVKLRYFDGANWIPVLSSGGLPPAKDTTDNLDGTVSGGRFAVVFDATSTPTIMDLTGTVFGMIESEPQLGAIAGPAGPVALGNAVSLTANFAVVGDPADAAVRFLWDDGTEAIVAPTTATSATATHRYAAPGVYGVTVQVTDGQGDVREGRYEYVVMFDPNGGFVTGGGWIDSLPGAYLYDPTLTGKATFGFTSRYQRGQSVPTGQTQFQFQAGDFKFHSTAYQWLVVAGAKAQYKGVGQVNFAGDYGFLLTATDGQLTGGGGFDKFRLKIWDRAGGSVVYDNRLGASDDLDSANPQAIGGGSIVIQKAK